MTGPLKNARHERFAQELAKGETADAAYELAGFEPNRGNATRLKANESVAMRVQKLKEGAAKRTEITVAGITERLVRIADLSEKTGITLGPDGEVKDTSPKHLSVSRNALMDAAKLNGLITDKGEVVVNATIKTLSDFYGEGDT